MFKSSLLEGARFRKPERLIIKTHFFIKGYSGEFTCAFSRKLHVASLKRNVTLSMICSVPQRADLETLYTALLILRRKQPLSSIDAFPKNVSDSS